MNATAVEKENAPSLAMKVVIIFDSRPLAARAITALENAETGVGATIKWDIKSWQSKALKRADLIGVTVVVAADADLIVFALDKTRTAADELLDWLEHWSEHRQIEDSAIMVFCPDESSPAFSDELKWFAEWRGLNFIESRDAVTPKNATRSGRLLPSEPQVVDEQILAVSAAK